MPLSGKYTSEDSCGSKQEKCHQRKVGVSGIKTHTGKLEDDIPDHMKPYRKSASHKSLKIDSPYKIALIIKKVCIQGRSRGKKTVQGSLEV